MIEYAAVYEPTYTDTETALTSTAQQAFNPCIPTTLPVPVNELGNHVANCHSNGFDTQRPSFQHYTHVQCKLQYNLNFKPILVIWPNRIVLLGLFFVIIFSKILFFEHTLMIIRNRIQSIIIIIVKLMLTSHLETHCP